MGHKASALRHDQGEGGGGGGDSSTTSTTMTLFWSLSSPRRQRRTHLMASKPPPPAAAAGGRPRARTASTLSSTPSSSSPPSPIPIPTPRREGPCPLVALPNEVLSMVFAHLGICDLEMVSEACHTLQQAAVADPTLWAHVELPVNDGRLSQQSKEQFLCRLLLPRRPRGGGGGGAQPPFQPPPLPTPVAPAAARAMDGANSSSNNNNNLFVTPTKRAPAPPPPAATSAALGHGGGDGPGQDNDYEEEEEDDGADFPRAASITRRDSSSSSSSGHGHGCQHHHADVDPAAAAPASSSSSSSSSSPPPATPTTLAPHQHVYAYGGCRAPHVRSLSLLGARDVTGGCLLAFSPSPPGRPVSAAAFSASCSLRELDLSHCPSLQLHLLVQALPSIRRSLTTLSLRNTDHLLNDAAVAAIIGPLNAHNNNNPTDPDSGRNSGGVTDPEGDGYSCGVTGLRALHLGTSTRRRGGGGARTAPDSELLTDATLHLLAACCPRLETLSLHNQASVTDEGVVALVRSVGGTLQGLDLGLCASLSDASVLALAAHCKGLRRLSLRNCWRVTDPAVRALLATNRGLEALNVYACTFLTPQAFDRPPAAAATAEGQPQQQVVAAAAAAAALAVPAVGGGGVGVAAAQAPGQGEGQEHGSLALREANLSYMRGLHGPALLRLARQTQYNIRELSVAKCDRLTNAALAALCLLCRLEALNVADCLGVDARFVHLLARRASAAAFGGGVGDSGNGGGGGSGSTAPAAMAAAVAAAGAAYAADNEEEEEEEEEEDDDKAWAWPPARPAPLGALHSLNARQCQGWTDATTRALLASEGCGARGLRRLYLGGTAAAATAASGVVGSGGIGERGGSGNGEDEEGNLEDGDGDGDGGRGGMWAASTAAAAAAAAAATTAAAPPPSNYPQPHLAPAGPLADNDAAAAVGVGGLTDESVALIAKTLGRGLQILDLEACAAVTDAGVLALFAFCHRLQRLLLSGLPRVTDASLRALLPPGDGDGDAHDAGDPAAAPSSPDNQRQHQQQPPPPPTTAALQRRTGRLPCLVDLHLNFCPRLSVHAVHELRRQRPDVLRVFNRRDMLLRGPPAF